MSCECDEIRKNMANDETYKSVSRDFSHVKCFTCYKAERKQKEQLKKATETLPGAKQQLEARQKHEDEIKDNTLADRIVEAEIKERGPVNDIAELVTRISPKDQSVKFDKGKPLPMLTPPEWNEWLTDILMVGYERYGAESWKNVEYQRYENALLRHWRAYRSGEMKNKDDNNVYHLAQVAWNALAVLYIREVCNGG